VKVVEWQEAYGHAAAAWRYEPTYDVELVGDREFVRMERAA
jgi:hypothetical protein